MHLFLVFGVLAAIVVLAATFLASCADRIAEATGISRSLAGLVLLAVATSLPEVTVGWSAVRMGAGDLAIGQLLGSSLFNLLILSLLDLLTSTRGRMLSRAGAAHALSATAGILLTAVVLSMILLNWEWTIFRVGAGSLAILMAYLFSLRLVYFDQRFALQQRAALPAAIPVGLRSAVIGYVVAATAIFLAAPRMTAAADEIATTTGLGETFVGTVFVAFVTSLPEAVTTLAAIRLGSIDMAVGNIFGSNAFNMVIVAVIDPASPNAVLAGVSPSHAITAIAVILVTSVAVLGLLYRGEKRWWVVEPDAVLMVLLILGALTLLYLQ